MRDDVQCLAVVGTQTGLFEALLQGPRVGLDLGIQVLVVEGENQIVVLSGRSGRLAIAWMQRAFRHAFRVADDAVHVQQDPGGIPYP